MVNVIFNYSSTSLSVASTNGQCVSPSYAPTMSRMIPVHSLHLVFYFHSYQKDQRLSLWLKQQSPYQQRILK